MQDLEQLRWEAVRNRVARTDFFYGVRTTRIFCRPGCASRQPRRENIEFFDSPEEAALAGYRACKRCQPAEPSRAERWIAEACRTLEADPRVSLSVLAAQLGFSPFHLQRRFKAALGLSPKQYARTVRVDQLAERLQGGDSVTSSVLDCGLRADRALGMRCRDYRQRAPDLLIQYELCGCSLGPVLVAWTGEGVCAVELGEAALNSLQSRFARARLQEGHSEWTAAVLNALDRQLQALDIPFDLRGTVFQRQVWHALQALPPGQTITYSELARRLARPNAVRAVAAACAANPIAVLFGCHRVLGADGGLRGYRWGLELKARLLQRESVQGTQRAGSAATD